MKKTFLAILTILCLGGLSVYADTISISSATKPSNPPSSGNIGQPSANKPVGQPKGSPQGSPQAGQKPNKKPNAKPGGDRVPPEFQK